MSDSRSIVRRLMLLSRKLRSRRFAYMAVKLARGSDVANARYVLLRYLITRLPTDDWIRIYFDLPPATKPRQVGGPISEGLYNDLDVKDLERVHKSLKARVSALSLSQHAITLESFEYAIAMMRGRFLAAYDMWLNLSGPPAIEETGRDAMAADEEKKTIAVVFPGSIDADFSAEIDGHDFVGRIATTYEKSAFPPGSGIRMDYGFLNEGKLKKVLDEVSQKGTRKPGPTLIANDRAGSRVDDHRLGILYQLKRTDYSRYFSTINTTLIIWRIVDWAIRNELCPTIYFADFYLGEDRYESSGYDEKNLLEGRENVLLSYYVHDIFAVHAYLHEMHRHGFVRARGKSEQIISRSTREFACALESRWKT